MQFEYAISKPVRPIHRQRSDPRAISSTQPAEPICPGEDPLLKPALYRGFPEIFAETEKRLTEFQVMFLNLFTLQSNRFRAFKFHCSDCLPRSLCDLILILNMSDLWNAMHLNDPTTNRYVGMVLQKEIQIGGRNSEKSAIK